MDCAGFDAVGLGPLIEGESAFPPASVTTGQSTIVPTTGTQALSCLSAFGVSVLAREDRSSGQKAAH